MSLEVNRVVFVGEQDGFSERELIKRLIEYFKESQNHALSAFLVRVSYDKLSTQHVALAIRSEICDKTAIVSNASRIFSGLFGKHEHLDILFVSSEQEKDLRKVCKSFFG